MIKREVKLSNRMETIISMVSIGNRVCDVGCDHGFVDIALIQRNIAPFCIGMDIGKGPLDRAKKNVNEYNLGDYIELRLSDGLKEYNANEADTLIIAGMGGPLINSILERDISLLAGFKELILSPQSEIEETRRFLIKNNMRIDNEEMVLEDGKYYTIIKAVPMYADERRNTKVMLTNERTRTEVMLTDEDYLFGPVLINKKSDILKSYLLKELEKQDSILCKLKKENGLRIEKRISEVEKDILNIRKALSRMK